MDQDEYKVFLDLIEKELDYMSAFDLADDEQLLPAAGALMVLKKYVQSQLQEQEKGETF